MPNPDGLPVFLAREKGQKHWEKQPATSVEDAARRFIRNANVKSGKTIEVLGPDQDPERDTPFAYQTKGNLRRVIK